MASKQGQYMGRLEAPGHWRAQFQDSRERHPHGQRQVSHHINAVLDSS